MNVRKWIESALLAGLVLLLVGAGHMAAQGNKVMGELQFSPATQVEARSGVWVDGQYVGYMKELQGDKKVMLLPGEHEISVRQSGFMDFTTSVVVESQAATTVAVQMTPNLKAQYPGNNAAELKLDIKPKRAAVFVDDAFVGNAGHFGGINTMLLMPGTHRIKVELPGYRTFETELNLRPGQKSKVETELEAGSIQDAGALIKERD